MRRLAFALVCAPLLGCGDLNRRDGFIVHPIRDSLSIDPDEAIIVRRNAPAPASILAFLQRLEQRITTAKIGAFDGDSAYVFGLIADVHLLPDGGVAILDRQAANIRVFDAGGAHQYTVGRRGDGPGEMDVPLALVEPAAGQLWVIDVPIHRFASVDGTLEFVDRIPITSFPNDACAAGGSVILHTPAHQPGATQSDALYRLDGSGDLQSSFAQPYRYQHRLAGSRMMMGLVTCTARSVLLGFTYQNRLDAYDSESGNLLWHASFEGVHIPPTLESERPDGRRGIRQDFLAESISHTLLRVAGGNATPAFVQFGRLTREDVNNRVNRYIVQTFAVDPAAGAGFYVGEELPEILTLTDDYVVLLHPEPYPRIEVARLPPSAQSTP